MKVFHQDSCGFVLQSNVSLFSVTTLHFRWKSNTNTEMSLQVTLSLFDVEIKGLIPHFPNTLCIPAPSVPTSPFFCPKETAWLNYFLVVALMDPVTCHWKSCKTVNIRMWVSNVCLRLGYWAQAPGVWFPPANPECHQTLDMYSNRVTHSA